MLMGDFNELIDQSEKSGGAVREERDGLEFKQMFLNGGLWDIKYKGDPLSWAGRRNNELVQCKLDRAVANQERLEAYPQATTFYLQRVQSDHSQILTSIDGHQWKKYANFKYDHRWVRREGFVETVERSWTSHGSGQASLMGRISVCRKAISMWKRQAKPNSALRIQELSYRIDEASRQESFAKEELENLRRELMGEYYNEEIFWMQKSRLNWLRSGDRNTKFFHAVTKNRRAQNRIKSLVDDEGNEWFVDGDLGRVAEKYFKSLFSSEDVGLDSVEWNEMLGIITPEQNNNLMRPVSLEEVKKAVFDINPSKCPGHDGLNGYLFQ